MKTSAIIAEYNPFHNGHLYQLQKVRENGATHVLAIMSGNYTQRGDFAIAPKHFRAEAAVKNGVDLVIEIPTPWAMSTAETFAGAGVHIANALGVVDELAFGSECADLDKLAKIAAAGSDETVERMVLEYLSEGITFAAARSKAISQVLGNEAQDILKNPNDILAVEYLKALRTSGSHISPYAVKRFGSEHDKASENNFFKSAAEIREGLLCGKPVQSAVPVRANEVFRQCAVMGRFPVSKENYSRQMLYALRRMSSDDYLSLPDIGNEGLHNKIQLAVNSSSGVNEILLRAKSKRYPMSRIRRIVMSAFLGIGDEAKNTVPYIRILALNERGAEILKAAKDKCTLPIVMKYSDVQYLSDFAKHTFELESRCTDIYATGFEKPTPCCVEKTQKPAVVL